MENLPIKECGANEVLIREGRVGSEMYVLLSGKVSVSLQGVEITVIDAKGSFIGEISALMGTKRIATITTITPCRFYVIENLSEYFTQNADSGFLMAKTLAGRLIQMNKNFVELKQLLLALLEKEKNSAKGEAGASIQSVMRSIQENLAKDFINAGESPHASTSGS